MMQPKPDAPHADLEIRPPRQQRTRQRWTRVLDAGLHVLEEGGYEAFTIAAVCERAQVAPPAIYARAASKDALFLAVYEHGMARLRAEQQIFEDADRWTGLPAAQLIEQAIVEVAARVLPNARFLRAVILRSGAHPEIYRRGAEYSREFGDQFATAVLRARPAIRRADPETAVRACFSTIFSALAVRVSYGPGFATSKPVDDDAFVAHLVELGLGYLLPDERHPG
jgi:AcrR family transcriptional regulator